MVVFENTTDIHSHVLWGVDDGAEFFDESVELCFMAEDCGTKNLFVTPHLMYWDRAEELFDIREQRVDELQETLIDEDSELIIKKGFEILCDDDIFNVKYFNPYTLNNSRYLLMEFDFYKTGEDDVRSWCEYISSFGLVPIIAHPERYRFVFDDISVIQRLSEQGVLFQINAGSPAGFFGEAEQEIACSMLNKGYVDFIGSDAHSLRSRNTDLDACVKYYPDFLNEALFYKAAVENPQAIINDSPYKPIRLEDIK